MKVIFVEGFPFFLQTLRHKQYEKKNILKIVLFNFNKGCFIT